MFKDFIFHLGQDPNCFVFEAFPNVPVFQTGAQLSAVLWEEPAEDVEWLNLQHLQPALLNYQDLSNEVLWILETLLHS